MIILVNFLIAFISETYEEVYSREKVDEFATMAKLNQDFRLMTRPYAQFTLKSLLLLPFLVLTGILKFVIVLIYVSLCMGCCHTLKPCFDPIWKLVRDLHENILNSMLTPRNPYNFIVVTHAKDYLFSQGDAFQGIVTTINSETAKQAQMNREFVHMQNRKI